MGGLLILKEGFIRWPFEDPMLEHSSLLVHDWFCEAPTCTRSITDMAGQPLGYVRLEAVEDATWFSWLRKVRLDVYETEDASHLMSLTRSWVALRAWDVYDAEDRHVGSIHPKTLMTAERVRVGLLDLESGDQGRINDPSGQTLAEYRKKSGDALEVTLTGPPDPFLRMLILGSILTLDPAP